ncbi:hypothetical protein PHAVU_003G053600 [Phaseolus vulgaris]|uniref:Uncharacterized protein n=1 Tax=Phaseolus vulgaris TaxID=3885 RepID=V7C673_PHAVU|nr:hypothetical protein PHAVU_003G053600g [Phaseolus vulgaris]ESW25647.1 hypothetical protein PHAVU_003G053600g [Phaseolus vulgaris]
MVVIKVVLGRKVGVGVLFDILLGAPELFLDERGHRLWASRVVSCLRYSGNTCKFKDFITDWSFRCLIQSTRS